MNRQIDLSIFEKFNFEYKPVGVKFLLTKPDGIFKLNKKLAICEMLKEAQNSDPFYTTKENHECKAGPFLLGMVEPDPVFASGQIGPELGVYEDPRANRRLYMQMPRLEKNSVNYVAFSSFDKMTFAPDLLIVTARPGQAEVLLRAYGYRTGAAWNAKGTSVLGCAYLYMYPYVSGELNVMITGLHHGMKARNLFPEGLLFITIPFDLLPEVIENLKIIQWNLPQYSWGKDQHLKRMKEIVEKVMLDIKEE